MLGATRNFGVGFVVFDVVAPSRSSYDAAVHAGILSPEWPQKQLPGELTKYLPTSESPVRLD